MEPLDKEIAEALLLVGRVAVLAVLVVAVKVLQVQVV
jgi:hypothetical protein